MKLSELETTIKELQQKVDAIPKLQSRITSLEKRKDPDRLLKKGEVMDMLRCGIAKLTKLDNDGILPSKKDINDLGETTMKRWKLSDVQKYIKSTGVGA